MSTFSRRLKEQREILGFSQSKLANEVGVHQSIIGRYERNEAKPTIDVVIKIASVLKTTVGFLLGEVEQADTFKDPLMLKRLHELLALPDKDREGILFALDGLLRDAKTRAAYS